MLVVPAGDHLGPGAQGLGFLLAAIGVGAATGPLLLSALTDDPRRARFAPAG